jgi:hypothetical protein
MDWIDWMRWVGVYGCDAMRCDTPPDIVEQTDKQTYNNGSFNNQIRSVALSTASCHIISYHIVIARRRDGTILDGDVIETAVSRC